MRQKRGSFINSATGIHISSDRKCECGKSKMRSFEWCEKCTTKKAKANILLIKKGRAGNA